MACTWAVGRFEVLKSFRSYWKVRVEEKLLLHIFFRSGPVLSPRPRRTKPAVKSLRSRAKRNKYTGYPQLLWAEAESLHNSQWKPVNNCGGSHDFPELQFQIWKSGSRPQNAQPTCYEWI